MNVRPRLLRLLVEPAPSVVDPIHRRRIRIVRTLCSAIMLIGGTFSLGSYWVVPHKFMGHPGMTLALYVVFALLLVGLATRWWRQALSIFSVVGTGVCWAMLSTAGSSDEVSVGLVLALLPFAFAVLLPGRLPMMLVWGVSIGGASVLVWAVPGLDLARFTQEMVMVFGVGGVLLGIQEITRADHRDLVRHAQAIQAAWTETQEARAAQSRFLSKIHHEFRTPLNGVIGAAQVLQEISDDPLTMELATAVQNSGDRLSVLVEDVLAYVAGEDEQLEINRVMVNAGDLVRDTVARSHSHAQRDGVTMRVEVADTPLLQLDPIRVSHIVGHLIRNAVRHSAGGSVRVEVWWRRGDLSIGVHDSGAGLDDAELQDVFLATALQSDEQTIGTDGFGLGLATSRVLAHAMGGTLTASSEPGCGCSFWLKIPAEASRAEKAA